ncbi:MAG: acylphosphatase [Candidatus Omnitrophica bacterium]|nr:acylphosphatase [Candidatus Omnitrophota bacterium]
MQKQFHAYFSGRVQGVGFRFTAMDIARELNVSGWVKNLSDARVEVVAEAEEDILLDFLSRLEQAFSRYIEDKDIDWQPASGKFTGFKLEY